MIVSSEYLKRDTLPLIDVDSKVCAPFIRWFKYSDSGAGCGISTPRRWIQYDPTRPDKISDKESKEARERDGIQYDIYMDDTTIRLGYDGFRCHTQPSVLSISMLMVMVMVILPKRYPRG